ncbi:hypothetical protein PGH07_05480 [Sulfurovum sp. zt1-1]|uniref:Uncharacterized protein n=1 Tax=Sulfurovum zhangzhouensis TaxID=3019067 RepID=A0ABT7QXW3_9BACT|nr:hypothetical protein [Sulfurovum zhangzhouensis]MDM5271618.1 hypothetical protein [Sulfurovum zhangzhouensis]
MKMKKNFILILVIGLIITLTMGCNSNNSENTKVEDTLSEGWEGELAWFILKGLSNGFLSSAGSEVFGNILVLIGIEDPSTAQEEEIEKTLKNVENTLVQIEEELSTIETELSDINKELNIDTDKILLAVNWPNDSVTYIHTGSRHLRDIMKNPDGSYVKPGDINHTTILNLSSQILNLWDIDNAMQGINDSILTNPYTAFPTYVDEAMTEISGDDTLLMTAYQGLEYFSTKLLNNQILGANLVVEAYKALDDNNTAEIRYNDYKDMFYNEVRNMENENSFIYNAASLVLRNATLYGEQKLPSDADAIFKRALFYSMLYTGTDKDKFGLRFLHISPTVYPVEFGSLYAYNDSNKNFYTCEIVGSHEVLGRTYDYWDGNHVNANNAYRVVEYDCGSVPIGEYGIYTELTLNSLEIGSATVSNYNADYTQSSDGNITYGFGLATDFIDNRFTESSPYWSVHRVSGADTESSGSANNWPIKRSTIWINTTTWDTSGSTELRGNFKYVGSQARNMIVDYHAEFYIHGFVPYYFGNLLTDMDIGYVTGVYNVKDEKSECRYEYKYNLKTYLTTAKDVEHSESRDIKHTCSFTAEPDVDYYVYFKVFIEGHAGTSVDAVSELKTVKSVYVKFEE